MSVVCLVSQCNRVDRVLDSGELLSHANPLELAMVTHSLHISHTLKTLSGLLKVGNDLVAHKNRLDS